MELVLVFVLGGVPFIKAGGRDYAALEGDTAAKHRLFRHRFGAAINEIVSAHPECSETTITYDYEDGHTWASYWPEVMAIFAVHTNLNSDIWHHPLLGFISIFVGMPLLVLVCVCISTIVVALPMTWLLGWL